MAPGWADNLIDLLTSPGITFILLAVGFLALYIELHTPGIGLGAFVAVVCFALFFWLHVLGGTAGWLEVTLFVRASAACWWRSSCCRASASSASAAASWCWPR